MWAPRTRLHATPDFVIDDFVNGCMGNGWLSEGTVLYDIGCGDGAVLRRAAERSGCRGVGWEINRDRAHAAQDMLREHDLHKRVEIRAYNFLDELEMFMVHPPVGPVLFYCYLTQRALARLAPHFKQLRIRVVTFLYRIPGVKVTRKLSSHDPKNRDRAFMLYYYDFSAPQDGGVATGQQKKGTQHVRLAAMVGLFVLLAVTVHKVKS
mmetsp:Transcript_16225/g.26460  ORF Transcript_16225/g.26460 Transcript_16225/m.26460 type:complete len:208 (+) Transcript_16225:621-1244(+)